MPRNFHRRVEVLVPILDAQIRARLEDILGVLQADTLKSWELTSDGSYMKVAPGPAPVRAQQRFLEQARDRVKQADQSSRGRRFHVLHVPQGSSVEERAEARRVKKKKKGGLPPAP
jgi:polyphosphate kinase